MPSIPDLYFYLDMFLKHKGASAEGRKKKLEMRQRGRHMYKLKNIKLFFFLKKVKKCLRCFRKMSGLASLRLCGLLSI